MTRFNTYTLYSCNMYTYTCMYAQGTIVYACAGVTRLKKWEGTHTYAAGVGKGGVYGHLMVGACHSWEL